MMSLRHTPSAARVEEPSRIKLSAADSSRGVKDLRWESWRLRRVGKEEVMFFFVRPAVAIGLALCALSAAHAATIKVPGDHATIQAAIDAASPGDTIKVGKGTYQENLVIPAAKTGLTLGGAKGTVLEARPAGGDGAGPGLIVRADGVTLRGVTIRNAEAVDGAASPAKSGAGLLGLAGGLTVRDCQFLHNSDYGAESRRRSRHRRRLFVRAERRLGLDRRRGGDPRRLLGLERNRYRRRRHRRDASVIRCDVGLIDDGDGIRIEGQSAVVTDISVRVCGDSAVAVIGDDATVLNLAVMGLNHALDVTGDNATIEGVVASAGGVTVDGDDAQLRDVAADGIEVEGDRATVEFCRTTWGGVDVEGDDALIAQVEADGISVQGADALISDNDVVEGISCQGDDPTIVDNVITASPGPGISIRLAEDGGLIEGNAVADVEGHGIFIDNSCRDLVIRGNTVTRSGFEPGDAGFFIDGEATSSRTTSPIRSSATASSWRVRTSK